MGVDGRKLTAEVNSETRAKTIRREIEKRLGTGARYRTTTVESPEAMMEKSADAAAGDDGEFPSQEELMQIPEVRRQIEKMLRDHGEGWADEPVPVLGDRSPRQAAKEEPPAGRPPAAEQRRRPREKKKSGRHDPKDAEKRAAGKSEPHGKTSSRQLKQLKLFDD